MFKYVIGPLKTPPFESFFNSPLKKFVIPNFHPLTTSLKVNQIPASLKSKLSTAMSDPEKVRPEYFTNTESITVGFPFTGDGWPSSIVYTYKV